MSVELFREDIAATIGRPKVNKLYRQTSFVPERLNPKITTNSLF